ncbi:Putative uncharacterized protein [Moritella viscosa]|uniref:Uncharacterized protein n=1 Tax=Moritella viscosa TaxID=80854 RepID=A0ABY1HFA7_9GAMM|nr:Putative uncharacterized protein [Moritella viscosa]
MVEQLTFNQLVEGSNPSQPTTFFSSDKKNTQHCRGMEQFGSSSGS